MITEEKTSRTFDRNQILSEATFKIKASAKAFKILSSGIYKDVIAAPIRELGTNAWDAHIAAGQTKPFLVHLPSTLEPYFSVTDYGVGMSSHEIEHIYTTYFESTKTHSNDYVGCLGLGSKSPFSYTDSFTVTSRQQGKQFVYAAFLEDGMPRIAKLAEDDTTEENGMEVSFSVKPEDINTFVSKARTVYSRFMHRPIIVGSANFSYPPISDILYEGDGWKLFKGNGHGNDCAKVVMGNIAYPISTGNLTSTITNQYALNNFLSRNELEIQFGIGDLEITADRENLQYTPTTNANITKKISSIIKEISDRVQLEISKIPCLWEARVYSYSLPSAIKNLIDINGGNIEWNKMPFNINEHYFSFSENSYGDKIKFLKFNETKVRNERIKSLSYENDIVFIENDTAIKMGIYARLTKFSEDNPDKTIYYIAEKFNKTNLNPYDSNKDKLIANLGIIPSKHIINLSSLSKGAYVPKVKNPKKAHIPSKSGYTLNGTLYSHSSMSGNWNGSDPILQTLDYNDATIHYLELAKGRWVVEALDGTNDFSHLNGAKGTVPDLIKKLYNDQAYGTNDDFRTLNRLNDYRNMLKIATVIGVRSSLKEKMDKAGAKWTELISVISNDIKDRLTNPITRNQIITRLCLKSYRNGLGHILTSVSRASYTLDSYRKEYAMYPNCIKFIDLIDHVTMETYIIEDIRLYNLLKVDFTPYNSDFEAKLTEFADLEKVLEKVKTITCCTSVHCNESLHETLEVIKLKK